MQLKVSPKQALGKIDGLLRQGHEIYSECKDNFYQTQGRLLLPDELAQGIDTWEKEAVDTLTAIFLDYAPVYMFHEADNGVQYDHMRDKLRLLNDYYLSLAEQVRTPLFYIPERAQICFFASVCAIDPDSNEDVLCRYMFENHSFHEWIEMEDVSIGAFGVGADAYGSRERTQIEHAQDGVNRKTNDVFGFPLFLKKKSLLCLNLPSRFLEEGIKVSS